MVCELFIDEQGKVVRSKFYDAVMSSHARLTYTEVAKMLVDGDEAALQLLCHVNIWKKASVTSAPITAP